MLGPVVPPRPLGLVGSWARTPQGEMWDLSQAAWAGPASSFPPTAPPPHQGVIFQARLPNLTPPLPGRPDTPTPLPTPDRLPASPASLLERPEARSRCADTPWWKQLITGRGKCARTLA